MTATEAGAPAVAASTRAERVAWYSYDWAISAFRATVITVFLGPYLTTIAERAAGPDGLVHPLGIPVATGSLFTYTVSASVLLTVPVLPLVGALADRSSHKKRLLALFAYIGAGAVIAMVLLTGTRWLLGAVLLLVANVAYGAAKVVFNSYLPQLAGPDDRDRISSFSWAIGYVGGGLLLAANLAALVVLGEEHKATVARWSIVSAGVWWAAFATVAIVRLPDRPAVAGEHTGGSALTDGFRQLWHTLKSARAYPLTLFFLAAYLVYNDGIQTVITVATIYADQELHLSQSVQIITILLVQFVAFGGAWLLGRVAVRFGAWRTIAASLVVWIVAVALAYPLPANSPVAFMLLGCLIGIVLGGSQALSRSLFSQMIPRGMEAEYYGLYEISSDGTSWLGPLLFGLAYQFAHSNRLAIASLVVFFVAGLAMLLAVPVRRAILAAGNTPPRVL
ncbi:MFS transporter [Dactylosporangium sp. NPDC051485]|uniref:MFS transporter n=1 Tax=Dactylosporangium sp. NPDC051485 TaxID=3154846 RepID=UPI00343C9A2F